MSWCQQKPHRPGRKSSLTLAGRMAVGGRGRRDGRESLHRRRWGARQAGTSTAADLGALWVLGLFDQLAELANPDRVGDGKALEEDRLPGKAPAVITMMTPSDLAIPRPGYVLGPPCSFGMVRWPLPRWEPNEQLPRLHSLRGTPAASTRPKCAAGRGRRSAGWSGSQQPANSRAGGPAAPDQPSRRRGGGGDVHGSEGPQAGPKAMP